MFIAGVAEPRTVRAGIPVTIRAYPFVAFNTCQAISAVNSSALVALAAYLADLLTEGVLSLFGKAFLLFFGLLMGFRAIGVTKPLPCAVRIKLLTALFADTLRVLMPVIRRPAFCLGFGLMSNITLTLPVLLALGFFRRFLLGFPPCFGNFLFGKWKVKLPDEVIVDVHLLLSVGLLAYGFVNNDFINQFARHLFYQLCGLLILLDEPDKPPDMGRGRFCFLQLLLNFRYLALKDVLFSRVFLHQGLVLLFGQQT